ncbi:MAG: hypothetical protein WB347_05745, partial [Terriglobales bacterium]
DPYEDPPIWERLLPDIEEVRRNLGYTRIFADRMNLTAMTPRLELASTGYCLAAPGSEYIVYQPDSGEFTVELAAGTYNFEWFSPVAGTRVAAGALVSEGGPRSFSAPFAGDAILYIKTTGAVSHTP